MEGKAVHFYNKKLPQAEFNFLNFKFPRFLHRQEISLRP